MHMADALLSPAVAATMYAASGTAAGFSIRTLKRDNNSVKLPVMAISSALVFAGQMINYTIPGTGSSGHLCGGMLLTALLGPQAGFLSMMVILTIQCLFFADGGLLALGANCWNMAFYGCFVGYYLIWKPIMNAGSSAQPDAKKKTRIKIILSSVLGCILSLQLGSFSVVLETSLSGITELPFGTFAAVMQPIHLAIGLVEGLITAAVLLFVYEARPELLMNVSGSDENAKNKCSLKTTLGILAILTLFIGGGLSLFASSNPDGLEWSLFTKIGLDEASYGITGTAADTAATIQENTSFLPDYAFAESDSPAGTGVAGILGSVIVAAVSVFICIAGGFFRRRKHVKNG